MTSAERFAKAMFEAEYDDAVGVWADRMHPSDRAWWMHLGSVAAGVVAEEPEWEYGNEQLMHSHIEIFPASSEAAAKAQAWLYPIRRRRKAGPWEPVE